MEKDNQVATYIKRSQINVLQSSLFAAERRKACLPSFFLIVLIISRLALGSVGKNTFWTPSVPSYSSINVRMKYANLLTFFCSKDLNKNVPYMPPGRGVTIYFQISILAISQHMGQSYYIINRFIRSLKTCMLSRW